MARIGRLTADGIEQSKPNPKKDRWLSDDIGERNAGRLQLRISPKGVKRFYFRYSVPGRDRKLIPLDVFSYKPKAGAMTLAQARDKATELRGIHKAQDSRDVRAYLHRQEKAKQEAELAERIRQESERAAVDAAQRFTVRALTAEYIGYLERRGKHRSALDARNMFKNYLDDTEFAGWPAKALQPRNVTELLRRVVEAGKGRTAGKLRSYLRAAYSIAIKADLDPAAPSAFIGFALDSNPVATVPSLRQFQRASNRTLTQEELFAYWRRLEDVEMLPLRAVLKLAVLLGGQRPTQLLRLRRSDVDLRAGRLVLFDGKGARHEPRHHELPITEAARAVLEPAIAAATRLESEWVFTVRGIAAVVPETLAAEVRRIAEAMQKAREVAEPFLLRDIRRTIETALASLGVSQDLRAQIQSHGLGGIQQKHYNRHDYSTEKREALEKWARWLLAGPIRSGKVITGRFPKSRNSLRFRPGQL
jgi:integrase